MAVPGMTEAERLNTIIGTIMDSVVDTLHNNGEVAGVLTDGGLTDDEDAGWLRFADGLEVRVTIEPTGLRTEES